MTAEPHVRPKATHGMGSVRPVTGKPGRWDCTILATAPTGDKKRLRKTVSGTKAQAQRAILAMKAEYEAGSVALIGGRGTLSELLEAYTADRAGAPIRERTRTLEAQYIARYVSPVAGGWVLNKVKPDHVAQLLTNLRSGGTDGRPMINTARKVHGILRRVFAFAVERGMLDRSPAAPIRVPRAPVGLADEPVGPRAYTRPEATHLMAAFKAHEDRAHALALQFALLTGMRRGEVYGLRWADVSLPEDPDVAARVNIRRTLSTGGQRRYEAATKTEAGRRTLTLSYNAAQALRRRYAQAGAAVEPGHYVFGGADGRAQSPDNALRTLRLLCGVAGVPYINFHALRHTYATLALEAGTPPAQVAAVLGHSMAVTLNTYAHLFREAAPAIDIAPAPDIL